MADAQKVAKACQKFAEGFAFLASAFEAAGNTATAVAEAVEAIRPTSPASAPSPEPEAPMPSTPVVTPTVPPPPTTAEQDAAPPVPVVAAVPPAPVTSDLESLGRAELKKLAEDLGINVAGKKASEIRDLLRASGAAPAVNTGPSLDDMKADLDAFIKLNKEALEDIGFFEDEPTNDPENPTYKEMMSDEKLITEAWKDNVLPYVQKNEWAAMKAQADALV